MNEVYIKGAEEAADLVKTLLRNYYEVQVEFFNKVQDEDWGYTIPVFRIRFNEPPHKALE